MHHFMEVAIAVDSRPPGIAGTVEIASVQHFEAAAGQGLLQTSDPQCLGAHRRTPIRRADIGRSADERRCTHTLNHLHRLLILADVATRPRRRDQCLRAGHQIKADELIKKHSALCKSP